MQLYSKRALMGMNYRPWMPHSFAELPVLGAQFIRLGGNRVSTFNWENNASNAGSDHPDGNSQTYFYPGQYDRQKWPQVSLLPRVLVELFDSLPGLSMQPLLDEARKLGVGLIVPVPMLDQVARDFCSNYDQVDKKREYKRNFARRPSQERSEMNTYGEIDAVYQEDWVRWLKQKSYGVPILFALDNEPELWCKNHADVRSDALTFREHVNRSIEYARMIKTIWPEAIVIGLCSYGWQGWETLEDPRTGQLPADSTGHFLEYYLQSMKAAETQQGIRLIDCIDIHWYPEAVHQCYRVIEDRLEADFLSTRVNSVRSLNDSTYIEDSWIAQWKTQGPIELIPRLKRMIDANYPGTGLCIGEWNFGGGNTRSGAVSTLEALLIFQKEKLAMAAHWMIHEQEPFVVAAYRLFELFGETLVEPSSKNEESDLAVYIANDSDTGRQTVLMINRNSTSSIKIANLVKQLVNQNAETCKVKVAYTLNDEAEVIDCTQWLLQNEKSIELPSFGILLVCVSS